MFQRPGSTLKGPLTCCDNYSLADSHAAKCGPHTTFGRSIYPGRIFVDKDYHGIS